MWCGGDVSQFGEAVLLLEPREESLNAPTAGESRRKSSLNGAQSSANPNTCAIGGLPCYHPGDSAILKLLREEQGPRSANADDDAFTDNASVVGAIGNPICASCNQTMHLLIQLYAPLDAEGLDRTLYLFGCNRSTCSDGLFNGGESGSTEQGTGAKGGKVPPGQVGDSRAKEARFNLGGRGVFRCLRSQSHAPKESRDEALKESPSEDVAISSSWGENTVGNAAAMEGKKDVGGGWGDVEDGVGWGDDGGDDWGDDVNSNGGDGTDDLEAMLAAMELKQESCGGGGKGGPKKKKCGNDADKVESKNSCANGQQSAREATFTFSEKVPAFPRCELDLFDEPSGDKVGENLDDDDDDNVGTGRKDDASVQKILAKYLSEEDDEDIIAAILGKPGRDVGGVSGGQGEKYERLPPDERAFLTFTDRTKRAPRQCARYAYGGVPLWSLPTPSSNIHLRKKNQLKGKKTLSNKDGMGTGALPTKGDFPVIPACSCASERVFEFQLLPTALHVLGVDQHASSNILARSTLGGLNSGQNDGVDLTKSPEYAHGGMNWGNVACYSCTNSCAGSREEFVVVQESVDGKPKKRHIPSNSTSASCGKELGDIDKS